MTKSFRLSGMLGFGVMLLILGSGIVLTNLFEADLAKDAVTFALTLDLTLMIPLAYLVAIRATSTPKFTVIPVFILSVLLASSILPQEHHTYLDYVHAVLPVAEVLAVVLIGVKVRQIVRAHRRYADRQIDFIDSLRSVLRPHVGKSLALDILATEVSIFYYATAGWRSNREVPSGGKAFTYHLDSSYLMVIGVFAFLIVLESISLHLLLVPYVPTLAWTLTGLSAYGLVFLTADMNAVRNRPI